MSENMKMPLPVQGYRPQSQATIDLANEGKILEEQVLRYLDKLAETGECPIDQRWLAIGRTDIQKGFMSAIRSIFQPKRAVLPGDVE